MEQKVYTQSLKQKSGLSRLLTKSFGIMFLGVLITFGLTYGIYNYRPLTMLYVRMLRGMGSGFMWILLLVQVGIVFVFSAVKRNVVLATILYVIYSITVGIVVTTLAIVYDIGAVYQAFLMAVALFGALSVIGYTTKLDLSKFSTLLFGGLIAVIIVSLLNVFIFKSDTVDLLLCFVGLVIFLGITAWDVQKIKAYYPMIQHDEQEVKMFAIFSGFNLYLDFINIFLYILRILGRKN